MHRLSTLACCLSLLVTAGCASSHDEEAVFIPVDQDEPFNEDEVYVEQDFEREPRERWTSPPEERRFGHWPQAEESVGPKVAGHLAEGDRLFDAGEFRAAEEEYTQALHLNSRLTYAYCNRGSARRRMKNYEGAIEDLTQAIRLRPGYALAYNNRGYALLLMGFDDLDRDLLERAVADFSKALEIGEDPQNHPSYKNTIALRNRAKAYRCLGNEERARRDEERALRLEVP